MHDIDTHISTAAQTQRGFAKLLEEVGTPACTCVPRGRNAGKRKDKLSADVPNTRLFLNLNKKYENFDCDCSSDTEGVMRIQSI